MVNKTIAEIFGISNTQAQDVAHLRKQFSNDVDFKSVLEGYFHVYDDYAEMSADDFNNAFKEFIMNSKKVYSSKIGDISDKFACNEISEHEAILQLIEMGKSKKEARNLINIWKSSRGFLKSSVDKAVKKIADYFGTEPENDTVYYPTTITNEDKNFLREVERDENVQCQIGSFSVTVKELDEDLIINNRIASDVAIKQIEHLYKQGVMNKREVIAVLVKENGWSLPEARQIADFYERIYK